MANHRSALKRIRSNESKRLRNRYQSKTARSLAKRILGCTDKQAAAQLQRQAYALWDKLAKRGVVHANKSARKKAQIARYVARLA